MASLTQGSRYGGGKLGSTHWSTGVYRYSTSAGGFPVRSTMIWRVYTNKDTYGRSRTKLAASPRFHSKVTQYWTPAGTYSQPHIYPHIHPPTVHPTFWPGNAPACTQWVKKGCHPNHGYNFVNSWSICKLLSLLQTAVNFQQNPYWVTHHTLSMLLHYLGKLKNQKFALCMHITPPTRVFSRMRRAATAESNLAHRLPGRT